MTPSRCLLGVSAALVLTALVAGTAGAQGRKQVRAVRLPAGDTIRIDGHLDEAAWQTAEPAGRFVERSPRPGVAAAAATEARFLYDSDALYVGIALDNLPGEEPRGLELARDASRIFSDDTITLKLDLFYDKRTTIGLGVNVSNAQIDYISVDNGDFRREFDALWESATSEAKDRWFVELRIPFATMGLPKREAARILGVQLTRDHNARNATYDWAPMEPEFGPVNALYYGDLVGIEGVSGGMPIAAIPYARLGWSSEPTLSLPENSEYTTLAGGEIRARLTSSFWAEVTALTDFAQVDLDDEVINLDRFALFLPEKRPFFLNGVDVFQFGAPQRAQVFFSRRIGLDENAEEIPTYGGVKLYGRAGPLRLGLLDIVTGDPTRNFMVSRARLQLGDNADVGAIATTRTESGAPNELTLGADMRYFAFDRRFQLTGFWASASENDPFHRDNMASQGRVAWLGRRAQPSLEVLWVEDAFDPAVGFVRRQDQLRIDPSFSWVERNVGSFVDRLTFNASGNAVYSADTSDSLGNGVSASIDAAFRSPFFARVSGGYREDVVVTGFELAERAMIEPGTYRGPNVSASAGLSSLLNPSGSIGYAYDAGFFGGRRHTVAADLLAAFGKYFRVRTGSDLSLIDLPGEPKFTTWALNTVLTATPSTKLAADLLGRVNTVEDSVTALFRVRWRYAPGSDLFLVYRERQDLDDDLSERQVTLKLTYRYDLQI